MYARDEFVAREFHDAYERLAPAFGYKTREASQKPWNEVPENNRMLMAAVVDELVRREVIAHGSLTRQQVSVLGDNDIEKRARDAARGV